MTLTSKQRQKFETLKRALQGEGDALDTVIVGEPEAAFGSDQFFYSNTDGLATSSSTWETLDEIDIPTAGGAYYTDLLAFYTGDETTRDYQIRFLLNDVPTGEIISKELKDLDDQLEYNTFNRTDLPEGLLNLKIQAQVQGGPGTITITRWRVRRYRVGA